MDKEFDGMSQTTKITSLAQSLASLTNTQHVQVQVESEIQAADILEKVYLALTDKGYNPVSQIVGYIMSGDPTYITNHMGARSLIMKAERDELLEEMLKYYIDHKLTQDDEPDKE